MTRLQGFRLLAVALIVAGVLGLVYNQFTYTEETHGFNVGSLEVAVKDKETVRIPLWLSVGAIAIGAVLLLSRRPGASVA